MSSKQRNWSAGRPRSEKARSEWETREATMMDAVNAAGRAGLQVTQVEQLRGLALEQHTAL